MISKMASQLFPDFSPTFPNVLPTLQKREKVGKWMCRKVWRTKDMHSISELFRIVNFPDFDVSEILYVPGQTLAASKGQFSSSSNHLPFSSVFLTFISISTSRLFFSPAHYLRTFSEIMRSKKIGRDFSFLLLSSRNDLI